VGATISVRQGNQEIRRYRLDQPGQYMIGSDPTCAIQVARPGVAGQHARLMVTDDSVQIEDLGSASGTFLDSVRLGRVAAEVREQAIGVGDAILEIKAELATAVSPSRPATQLNNAPPLKTTKYELGETVARGGMGVIWRAQDRDIQRTVAVKVVLAEVVGREDLRQRFLQEARLTGQLEHPNIVPVHELSFDEHGLPFYTMKLVKGRTLQEVLDSIRSGEAATVAEYSLARLLTVFQKVCDAMAFAHSKGVIHRDLKPANLMIGEYGEVLVMDWGLAKIVEHGERQGESPPEVAAQPGLTLAGAVMGSPQFMAPEQAAGKLDEIDARTDIFALGGILYNLLTLHPPISGDSVAEMLRKSRAGEILPPSSYGTKTGRRLVGPLRVGTKTFPRPPVVTLPHCPGEKIPEGLSAVAMKALALRREDRYRMVQELQNDITAYQNGFTTSVEKAGPLRRFTLLVKRNRRAAWATVLLTSLFAVGFSIFLYSQMQKKRAQHAGFIESARRHEQQNDWNSAIDQMTRANVILDTPEGRTKLVELLVRSANADIARKSWGAAAIKVQRASTLAPENPQIAALLPLVLGEGFLSVEAGFAGELIEFFYNEDLQPVIDAKTQQPKQESRGSLPLRTIRLAEGIHYFELWNEGKRFCSLPVEIVRGQQCTVQIPITKIPEGYEYIHEGEFIQGDDTTQREGRVGRRKIAVPSFFIKRTPVTMFEYRQFYSSDNYETTLGQVLNDHGLKFSDLQAGAQTAQDLTIHEFGDETRNPRPVTGISYYEALAYAKWVGARLPTDEQWEKAARGIDGRAFATGNFTPAPRPADSVLLRLDDPTHEVTPYGCIGLTDTYWQWTSSQESPQSIRRIVKGGIGAGSALDRKPSRQKELDPNLRYRTVTMIVCQDLDLPVRQEKARIP